MNPKNITATMRPSMKRSPRRLRNSKRKAPSQAGGLYGGGARVHLVDQNAFAIGRAEECAELAAEIFRVNAQPRLSSEKDVAGPVHCRHIRDLRHMESKSAGRRRHLPAVATIFGFAESDAQGLRFAISPQCKLRGAACRNFVDHAAELRGAFDALAVDFRHHVVFLEACLGGGAVRNNLA